MTTIETREPARTDPREAQSAGSRQAGLDLTDLILIAMARLCVAAAAGLCCAVAYARGWSPGISLAALFLLWHYVPLAFPGKAYVIELAGRAPKPSRRGGGS